MGAGAVGAGVVICRATFFHMYCCYTLLSCLLTHLHLVSSQGPVDKPILPRLLQPALEPQSQQHRPLPEDRVRPDLGSIRLETLHKHLFRHSTYDKHYALQPHPKLPHPSMQQQASTL